MTSSELQLPDPGVPACEGRPLPYPDEPLFDQGLAFDVDTISRRRVLRALRFGGTAAHARPRARSNSRPMRCSPPARRPLWRYSFVIHGRRPRIWPAASSESSRTTYGSS